MNKIAYLTDAHIDEPFPISLGVNARKNWQRILDDVKSRGIDEIIFGGDMGESESNRWFFNSMIEFDLSVTLGNHDEFQEVKKHFMHFALEDYDELFYAFEKNGFKRIYLDSSAEAISMNQLQWLKKELDTELGIIIFIHHAIFPVATPIDQKHYLRGREAIQELLIDSGKEISIFCGHYHMDDVKKAGRISQYISPAASYQVIKSEETIKVTSEFFGYRIIKFDHGRIETEVISFDT